MAKVLWNGFLKAFSSKSRFADSLQQLLHAVFYGNSVDSEHSANVGCWIVMVMYLWEI